MRIEVGTKMYLFLASGELNKYADRLVISAHGGIRKTFTPEFAVPYGKLQFYSQHGVVTDDFGLRNFASGGKISQQTNQIMAGQRCYNYDLSKYQGRHNQRNETYTSIVADQNYAHQLKQLQQEASDQGIGFAPNTSATSFDVLTIRHRVFQNGMNLRKALDEVGIKHRYPEIHCYFCRSFYFY